VHARAQRLALGFLLDLLRDADVLVLRQVDQHAAGDRDLGRQARALGADRILDHLHGQHLAVEQDLLDRVGRHCCCHCAAIAAVVGTGFPDVGHVQEGGALQADVDEGRLHARQHPHDLAE
jgi:hypothetical protein